MTNERRARILEVADELEAQGLPATNSAVYARVMGHRGHAVQTLKPRTAGGAGAGGGGEAEGMPETPAAELQEDLQQLEHAYESWHLALERLWELEQDG